MLTSELLENRIQGIRELNDNISDNADYDEKNWSVEKLIEWITENGLFSAIWDARQTHLQLIQRSDTLFSLLLKKNLLTNTIMEMFWNLTKSDYKKEVFKIITEAEYQLGQPHIEFLYAKIIETAPDQLEADEFEIINILGRRARNQDFKTQVCEFFWSILSNSTQYSIETIQVCTAKFARMVFIWDLELKQELFFSKLAAQIGKTDTPVLPIINLFDHMMSDIYSYEHNMRKQKSTSKWVKNLRNKSGNDLEDEEEQEEEKLQLYHVLDKVNEQDLVGKLLKNL